MQVDIRILDQRLPGWGFPGRGSAGAAGIDLHACLDEPLCLPAGSQPVLISAGFALRLPGPDWCALLAPRSGLGHRGLVLGNAVGIVDSDYEGPVRISAWNRNPPGPDGDLVVRPGDRIAQLLVVPVVRPDWRVVEAFGVPSGRAAGGFGSTGIAGAATLARDTSDASP